MKVLICDKVSRIIKSKKKLEKELDVKITNRGKEVTIMGSPEDEYIAEKVIDALNFGFPFSVSLLIKKQDFMFETINIKDYTNRQDLERVRARIIGTKGKTLQTLSQLTNCFFELKDNFVGIVGFPDLMQNAQNALISIIKGSKQSNVYSRLEKNQVKYVDDLGLKKVKDNL